MKRTLVLLFSLIICLNLFAQKEATWWYFGTNAGISFTGTGGAPVAQSNGKMNNLEGVASISNSKGGLLFYTDGEFVYNKSHNTMTNGTGLKGHNSSTQSAVIVQQPVRTNRFFIFTVDEEWGSNGFQYSIVDTALSGGQGQVVSSPRSIPLLSGTDRCAEKVSAVKHANKVDTWVVTHTGGNNKFYVYKLSSAGVSSSPVISSVGPVWANTNKGYSKGYLKFSPDGTKLVAAVAGFQNNPAYANNMGRIEVYDFDNLTGVVSNPQIIDKANVPTAAGKISAIYGCEFSPNGRFAYFSFYIPQAAFGGDGNDGIWQMDMSSGIADTMAKSILKVTTSSTSSNSCGGMQLGPDGVIYIARYNASYLSSITKPNCKGTACNFVNNGISLSSGRRSQWGIPTFIATFFNKSEFDWGTNAANLCEGSLTKFFVTDSTGIDSAKWKFNDPSTGKLDSAKGFTVFHRFSQPKTYNVFVEFFRKVPSSACYADTARKKVTIFPNPKVNLGRDTVICDKEEVILRDTTSNTTGRSYVWSDNTTVPTYVANTKGWHWIDVRLGGCTGSDSMYLDVIKYPDSSFVKDTILICQYDSIMLTASSGQRYIWSLGDTTPTAYVQYPGNVWVGVANGACFTYDTVNIKVRPVPTLSLGKDTILCNGDSITLKAVTNSKSNLFLWSDFSSDSILKVKTTGIYWARTRDTMCISLRDSVQVTFQNKLTLNLGKDTFICQGGSYLINAPVTGGKNWLWYDNTKATSNLAKTAGNKYVTVTNGVCSVSDTINITEITKPSISLGLDITLCNGDTVDIIKSPVTGIEYTWMGTVKNYSYPITKTGKYYVDLVDIPKKVCKSTDTIQVTFKSATKINLGKDTTLCLGQTVNLNMAKYGFVTYKWWDNATAPSIRKNDISRVKHWAEGSDGVCTSFDTININYLPALSVSLGLDIDLCDNATTDFDLTTNFATQYEWMTSTGTNLAFTPKYTVASPGGTFVGKVSDGYCPKYDTVIVNYLVTPVVDIGADKTICDGSDVVLDASGAAAQTYTWNTGANLPQITVSSNAQGEYWVKAFNGKCTSGDSAWVYFSTPPSNSFGFADSVFCDNPNLTYDFTQPNTTYRWMDGYTLPTRKIRIPGPYWMVAENDCGIDSIYFFISVDENGCRLNFPSAFSPNGDGINDLWQPTGQVIEWVELVIYDRWGEVIYKGDPFWGWDGIVGGKYVQDGVYPMTISYRQSTNGYPRLYFKNMTLTVVK